MKVEGRQDLVLCLESCSTTKAPPAPQPRSAALLQQKVQSRGGGCAAVICCCMSRRSCSGGSGGVPTSSPQNKTVFSIIVIDSVLNPWVNTTYSKALHCVERRRKEQSGEIRSKGLQLEVLYLIILSIFNQQLVRIEI